MLPTLTLEDPELSILHTVFSLMALGIEERQKAFEYSRVHRM